MENIDFEIQTLLQSTGYKRDDIKGTLSFDNDFPVVENGGLVEAIWPQTRRRHNSAPSKDGGADDRLLACGRIKSTNNLFWKECFHRIPFDTVDDRSRSNSESDNTDDEAEKVSLVKCPTFGTEYQVQGMKPYEMPVIGTFIDPRIVAGFRYKVRQLGSKHHYFDGNALRLVTIGLGYGKRMTFEGCTRNYNPNFFWSDSIPEGFGLSIEAVTKDDKFAALSDEGRPAAEITVQDILSQKELSQEINNGAIAKTIKVTLVCDIVHMTDPHGMMPLRSNSLNTVIDMKAILVKPKGAREAFLKEVLASDVPFIGSCILLPMDN